MNALKYPVAALIFAALATPALAQHFGGGARFGGGMGGSERIHVFQPSTSLSTTATSPFQAQLQDSEATQLRAEQRGLLLNNPSGTTRQELQVGNELNGFTPR